MTRHMWDGYWFLANPAAFEALPEASREVVQREFGRAADDVRADLAKLNGSLRQTLVKHGMTFNDIDPAPFRDALRKAGFYAEWKKRFGDQAWTLLENVTGPLS
jgi:TRAP-type C4-dicarboxylate transport system substrate-binding protein